MGLSMSDYPPTLRERLEAARRRFKGMPSLESLKPEEVPALFRDPSSVLDEMIVRLYISLDGEHKREFWQIRARPVDKLLYLIEHGKDPMAQS